MKLTSKNNKPFDPHPEYNGPSVCVDVTPLKTVQTGYGPKEQFRLVFETTELRQDGTPFQVWSRGFTPTLGEKSALRSFLKQWFGRDLTATELEEMDTETLVGRPASLVVVHNSGDNGEVYANIGLIRPDKSGQPLKASGKFVRAKDRDNKDANYKRVDQPAAQEPQAGNTDWCLVKVHVGKHQGIELCDLDREAVRSLHERWLPTAREMTKPLKADRDLMAALEKAAVAFGFNTPAPAEDDIPY